MKLFSKKNKAQPAPVQTADKRNSYAHPFSALDRYSPCCEAELELYSSLREAVPLIDAALCKLVHLVGNFTISVEDERFQKPLEQFAKTVKVGACSRGLLAFVHKYIDQLITYGTAIGEIVPDSEMRTIAGLYNASLKDVMVARGESPMEAIVCRRDINNTPVENQQLVIASLLNADAGSVKGNSILKGLPFVSSILLKILTCIGNNFDRAGNIRYAVTYKPSDNSGVNARQRASEIAREWSRAMRDDSGVCDFVAVGDVSVKVIGADSQVLDCDIPVRHILEQIVSKLCIPPFLLGLSWSSTERMSSVQADILTSEIEYFRSLLTPVIEKIACTQLRFLGSDSSVSVVWNNVSLQDETELAQARLWNAQAEKIEREGKVST